MGTHLERLLLPAQGAQRQVAIGAYLTAWNPATGENTVSVGAASYTDLPAIRSAVTGVGPVLLLFTPEPFIVGTIDPVTPA